jgi:hypothetical protein
MPLCPNLFTTQSVADTLFTVDHVFVIFSLAGSKYYMPVSNTLMFIHRDDEGL